MGCARAELVARAAPAGHVQLERRRHVRFAVARIVVSRLVPVLDMGSAVVAAGDEGLRILEGEPPTGDVRAQVDLAHLEDEALAVERHEEVEGFGESDI